MIKFIILIYANGILTLAILVNLYISEDLLFSQVQVDISSDFLYKILQVDFHLPPQRENNYKLVISQRAANS
jgi:hypothetical protein